MRKVVAVQEEPRMKDGSARILVVDDEKVIRDLCARILTTEGHIVEGAENPDIGLKVFEEFRPDIVLVDLKMPGRSGMEVLDEIERADPTVVKIVITGYGSVPSAVDAMKRGAYDFIPKPFTPEEMSRIIGRALEKRRLLIESEILRAEQERVRRNMISLVSHELRAPLASAVQYLEVILRGMAGEVSSEAKEMIDRCTIRLRELLELLSRWLSLATFDPAKMRDQFVAIDLTGVVRESIEVMQPLAQEKGVALSMDAPEYLSPIAGNKMPLKEVFNNLIGNAIKYNREGGWVRTRLFEEGQGILLEISDSGLGIEEQHLPRIFDEFYRVDSRRNAPIKGSGLGLAIAKKLVDAHGGVIDVESEFGQGTIFRVKFPKHHLQGEG
jgi:two-component system sensor histidine kinase/response regulator